VIQETSQRKRPNRTLIERHCERCGKPFFRRAYLKKGLGRFCGNLCSRASRIIPFEERFWSKVDKTPGQGPKGTCWTWTAATDRYGYGLTSVNRHPTVAHRVARELDQGPIPAGLCVLHKCDNPPCVNPKHLFIGTKKDNAQDAIAKGRWTQAHTKNRKLLTESQVRDIRQKYATGVTTFAALGKHFGVSSSTINHIVHRRNWADVD
jgi:hypothetical protein